MYVSVLVRQIKCRHFVLSVNKHTFLCYPNQIRFVARFLCIRRHVTWSPLLLCLWNQSCRFYSC